MRFMYVEPCLHLWEEAHLIVVDELFAVFVNLAFRHFTENFCISVHKGDQPLVYFFYCILFFIRWIFGFGKELPQI